jgi:hypothetical protein
MSAKRKAKKYVPNDSKKVSVERRTQIATDFRARLLAELGPDDGSVAREVIVDVCVSAFVECKVLSGRFLGCSATASDMDRCSRTRGQLLRTLEQLGLVREEGAGGSGAPSDEPRVSTWLESWKTRRKAQDDGKASRSVPSGAAPETPVTASASEMPAPPAQSDTGRDGTARDVTGGHEA